MNLDSDVHHQHIKRHFLKSSDDTSRTQFCDTEINETEENSENGKDFDLAKINFTISQYFTFKAFVLKQTYLSSSIFKAKDYTCHHLFVLFLNFRI